MTRLEENREALTAKIHELTVKYRLSYDDAVEIIDKAYDYANAFADELTAIYK